MQSNFKAQSIVSWSEKDCFKGKKKYIWKEGINWRGHSWIHFKHYWDCLWASGYARQALGMQGEKGVREKLALFNLFQTLNNRQCLCYSLAYLAGISLLWAIWDWCRKFLNHFFSPCSDSLQRSLIIVICFPM